MNIIDHYSFGPFGTLFDVVASDAIAASDGAVLSTISHRTFADATMVADSVAATNFNILVVASDSVEVTDTVPAYVQQAYIKASNTGAGDAFAGSTALQAVAIDGDTMVAGAINEDGSGTGVNPASNNNTANSGAAYVFTRTAGVWSQQAYVKASNTAASDFFGTSVAIDGDTMAISATDEDSNATGVGGSQANNFLGSSGAVYVFLRTAGVWAQQAYVKSMNTGLSGRFGSGVGVSGDTLAAGAPGESSPSNSGEAYVYLRTAGVWANEASIQASNRGFGDNFGFALAIDGDTLVVGAPGEASNATGIDGDETDNGADGAGAVYVFTRTAGVWSQQAYIKASNAGAGDIFGRAVALDGDTLVVGAPNEDSNATGIGGDQASNGASNAGAVYVFTRTAGVWSQQAYIKSVNTAAGDLFGTSVSVSGDRLAIGAPGEDSIAKNVDGDQASNGASNAGAVYGLLRTAGVWAHVAYIKASNTEAADDFGRCVSLHNKTLAVGATNEDSNATGIDGNQTNNSSSAAGAAYMFVQSPQVEQ